MGNYVVRIVILSLVLSTVGPVHAVDFFRWVDRNGVVHFTDNLHNIPEAQRHTATRIQARESPRAPEPDKPVTKVSIPIERLGHVVVVDAMINGKASAKLIVDTGASLTMISSATARELGIYPEQTGRTVPFNTANGPILAPLADLDSISVGGIEMKNLTAAIHDALPNSAVSGLLGLNFLSHFRMDIDTEKGMLHLEKR